MATHRKAFAALALALALTAPATADTLEVPDDYSTIQAAIDAASAGDTIEIEGGVYHEQVVVSSSLTGLEIKGKGNVVIDAHPSQTKVVYGFALWINADGVKIEDLTLRHARNSPPYEGGGVMVDAANDVVFEDVIVEDCDDYAFYLAGTGVRLRECTVRSCRYGVKILGEGARVEECTFRHIAGHYAIEIEGPDAVVKKCTFRACESGIRVVGAKASVIENSFEGFVDKAIHVQEPGAIVAENEIRNGRGIGIEVDTHFADAEILENEVCDIDGAGIWVTDFSTNVIVARNEVVRCGRPFSSGFWTGYALAVTGDLCCVLDNEVLDSATDGIHIVGDNNLIAGNKVKRSQRDGIRIAQGSNNQVIDNKAKSNGGEGLCNLATGSTFSDNTAKKNRIDVANLGTFTLFTGNTYTTGGESIAPEIED